MGILHSKKSELESEDVIAEEEWYMGPKPHLSLEYFETSLKQFFNE